MKLTKMQFKRRGEAKGKLLAALLFFFLFPYLFSYFGNVEKQEIEVTQNTGSVWVAQKKLWGTKKILLEEYLPGMLAATIPIEYELETLKAQAVVLRSWCMSLVEKEQGIKLISDEEIKTSYFTPEQCKRLWGEAYDTNLAKIKQAVEDTAGMILVWQEQIIIPPFFRVSNGSTRDVKEYLVHHEDWGYLVKADCPEDLNSSEYVHYIQISENDFKKKMAGLLGQKQWEMEKIILCRDSADYVKKLQVGEKEIEGETFRYEMGLPSACFSLEKTGENIEFQVKGMGHGFGFSQYEANEQAKGGNDFKALLNFFYTNITIEKM